jgi:hypothetical protein
MTIFLNGIFTLSRKIIPYCSYSTPPKIPVKQKFNAAISSSINTLRKQSAQALKIKKAYSFIVIGVFYFTPSDT